ncbi:MAG: ComF family protein [Eubacteriales bacterium]|nr:ComF family protein [Eubacteriales bacterium]
MGRKWIEIILDLLFPRRCPLCGELSEGICSECGKKIVYVRQPLCFRCGKPLAAPDMEYCGACSAHRHAYTQGRALCLYTGPVKEAVHAIKYKNKREYLEVFAGEIEEKLGPVIRRWNPEVILPIPMYSSARRRRGYNQAEILAKELGKRLGLPVDTKLLKKKRKTLQQKELDYRSRRSNLKGAFSVEYPSAYRRVLLADDVYTTGSTMDEAARTLKEAGVEEIYFVTICIVPDNLPGLA